MRCFIYVKNKTTDETKDDRKKEKEKERREKGKWVWVERSCVPSQGKKKGNIKEDQTKQ
jgi:hypothetical protein